MWCEPGRTAGESRTLDLPLVKPTRRVLVGFNKGLLFQLSYGGRSDVRTDVVPRKRYRIPYQRRVGSSLAEGRRWASARSVGTPRPLKFGHGRCRRRTEASRDGNAPLEGFQRVPADQPPRGLLRASGFRLVRAGCPRAPRLGTVRPSGGRASAFPVSRRLEPSGNAARPAEERRGGPPVPNEPEAPGIEIALGRFPMKTTRAPKLQKVPVYEVRLVKARRCLRVAEPTVSDPELAARVLHAMLGLTDREHFAALFLSGNHQVTGAHVVAIGGQHGIGTIEARTVFRAAIAACAAGLIVSHNHPSGVMQTVGVCRPDVVYGSTTRPRRGARSA
jgi:hypothetical protein